MRRLIAFVLAVAAVATVIIVSDPCKTLTPDDWFWYWWYSCGGPSAGGGGGGAG